MAASSEAAIVVSSGVRRLRTNKEPHDMRTTWADVLGTLLRRADLTADQAVWAMTEIIDGDATSAQTAGFLLALRAKGETANELAAMSEALVDRAPRVDLAGPVVDLAGTGGDKTGTVNLSTLAAIVVAATGTTVVKHGGRGATSKVGSADLLERLGIGIDEGPEELARTATSVGIAFCFAPRFHPGLRHAAPVRRELGVPTAINLLAPLSNPVRPTHQLVGVADPGVAPLLAEVLAERKVQALLASGDDGLDELTTTTTSQVWEVRNGEIRASTFDPRQLGLNPPHPTGLQGGDAEKNAEVARRVLEGEKGPVRDAVTLNAAGALSTFDSLDQPLSERLERHLAIAEQAIDSGAANALLDKWSGVACNGSAGRGN
jgi:anthranilate phosphoribosyltransferase